MNGRSPPAGPSLKRSSIEDRLVISPPITAVKDWCNARTREVRLVRLNQRKESPLRVSLQAILNEHFTGLKQKHNRFDAGAVYT